jgi:hypothetical protein
VRPGVFAVRSQVEDYRAYRKLAEMNWALALGDESQRSAFKMIAKARLS